MAVASSAFASASFGGPRILFSPRAAPARAPRRAAAAPVARAGSRNGGGGSGGGVARVARQGFAAALAAAAVALPCAPSGAALRAARPAPAAAAESAVSVAVASDAARARTAAVRVRASARPRAVAAVLAPAPAVAAPSSDVVKSMPKYRFSLRDRANYMLSEFFMWNSFSRILFLFAVAVVIIYIGSLAFSALDPDGSETNQSPVWMSVRSYLNPMEDDYAKGYLRVLSVTMALVGTVFFGIFIGMVTEAVESGIASADHPASRVVASNHTVICGWNANTSRIIADVNAVSKGGKVVVLVNSDEREGLMEELQASLSDEQLRSISISVRSGTPVIQNDMDRVAASLADKIILSAGRGVSAAESDRRILSRALAIRTHVPQFSGDLIAELTCPRDEQILQSILKGSNARSVQAVAAERLLFRFMAQAVRQEGLADCVSELMGQNPATVFHIQPVSRVAPSLAGMQFSDIPPTTIPKSLICGYVDKMTGKVVIDTFGSKDAPMLTAKSELLLLGSPIERRGSKRSKAIKLPSATQSSTPTFSLHAPPKASQHASESILVCGWRPGTMDDFLTELDTVLGKGSSVTIIDEDAPDPTYIESDLKLKHIHVTSVQKRAAQFSNLEALLGRKHKAFDRVLVLSAALGKDTDEGKVYRGVEDDSKALTSLCYINELLKSRDDGGASTTVTIEFGNEQVAEIARGESAVSNIILPNSLSAHIAAQTVRDSRLNSVWDELLSQAGREVYLRPASVYMKSLTGVSSFSAMCDDTAKERQEIIIGYVPKEGKPVINPSGPMRFDLRTWSPADQVIVIAENP